MRHKYLGVERIRRSHCRPSFFLDFRMRRNCRRRQLPRSGKARRQILRSRNILQLRHLRPSRNVRGSSTLAQLQGPDICRHRPAILRRQLRRVIRHRPIPVRNHIEVMAQRLRPPYLVIQIASRLISPLHNRTQPVSNPRVARRAVDIEPLLTLLQDRQSRRKRPSRCSRSRPMAISTSPNSTRKTW